MSREAGAGPTARRWRKFGGNLLEWVTHLVLRTVCAASSSLECFWEGPNMRAPPCSSCPLAGAHVGLCAVVMVRRSVRPSRCGDSLTRLRDTTGKHIRFHKLIMQHLFCTCLLLLLYNFCDAQIISHTTFFGRILVHIRIHAPFVPHAPS